jgi:hypothetical protein
MSDAVVAARHIPSQERAMRRSRLSVHALPLSAVLLLAPELEGQSWVTLPNGELGFITSLTTTGFFQCGEAYAIIGSCQVSENSITLGSGGSFMTMTFQGLSQMVTATNVGTPIQLGTVTKSFSGSGPFLFPASRNINTPLFYFFINLAPTGGTPGWTGDTWGAGYLPLSRTSLPKSCCDYLPDFVVFDVGQSPAPFAYGALGFDGFWETTMTATGEPMSIYTNVGILPEPSTIWLTGTGIVGVVAALYRRRKHSTIT